MWIAVESYGLVMARVEDSCLEGNGIEAASLVAKMAPVPEILSTDDALVAELSASAQLLAPGRREGVSVGPLPNDCSDTIDLF